MSIGLQVYIQLIEAKDDKTRARVIADAFEALEARLAQITSQTTQAPPNTNLKQTRHDQEVFAEDRAPTRQTQQ